MTSGPIVIQVLEGEDAIARYRDVMGATDPKEATDGSLRKLFAEREIKFAFRPDEIVG